MRRHYLVAFSGIFFNLAILENENVQVNAFYYMSFVS